MKIEKAKNDLFFLLKDQSECGIKLIKKLSDRNTFQHLFNTIANKSVFTTMWRISEVALIFKDGYNYSDEKHKRFHLFCSANY